MCSSDLPNEYVPSAAVVVVMGWLFPPRMGLPDELSSVTLAPAIPLEVPDAVAVPDSVAPHCDTDGAETVIVVDAGLSVVVTFDELVVEPVAVAGIDDDDRPVNGPVPVGQTASAVSFRHNCGASPTA